MSHVLHAMDLTSSVNVQGRARSITRNKFSMMTGSQLALARTAIPHQSQKKMILPDCQDRADNGLDTVTVDLMSCNRLP